MIRALVKSRHTVLKLSSVAKFSRLSSDSAPAAARDAVLKGKPVDVASSAELFPWLTKPASSPFANFFWSAYNQFRVFQAFRSLSAVTGGNDADVAELKNMTLGSQEAMKCASAGIFQHRLMKAHYIGISTKYNKTNDTVLAQMKEASGIELTEIFDDKLKDFYLYAIQKHCLKVDRLCTYSLLSVDRALVVDLQIMLNATRGNEIPKHDRQVNTWGVNYFINLAEVEGGWKNVAKLFELFEAQVNNIKDSAVRIRVDVDCTEVFAVSNAVSGEVFQGSLEPQRVTHQLVLENYVDGKTHRLAGNWTIVDIDDWMGGNEFWAKERIARADADKEE